MMLGVVTSHYSPKFDFTFEYQRKQNAKRIKEPIEPKKNSADYSHCKNSPRRPNIIDEKGTSKDIIKRYKAAKSKISSPRKVPQTQQEGQTKGEGTFNSMVNGITELHKMHGNGIKSIDCSFIKRTPNEIVRSRENQKTEFLWLQHRWLATHGKADDIQTYRKKMELLRMWFEYLDADGSGQVGVEELEDPLVSLGLAESREDVRKLIFSVDKSCNGVINFNEFLSMMNENERFQASASSTNSSFQSNTSDKINGRNPVQKLFAAFQAGKIGDMALPFPILITAYRRKMIMNAHMSEDLTEKRDGLSVVTALERTRREAEMITESELEKQLQEKRQELKNKRKEQGRKQRLAQLERLQDLEEKSKSTRQVLTRPAFISKS